MVNWKFIIPLSATKSRKHFFGLPWEQLVGKLTNRHNKFSLFGPIMLSLYQIICPENKIVVISILNMHIYSVSSLESKEIIKFLQKLQINNTASKGKM